MEKVREREREREGLSLLNVFCWRWVDHLLPRIRGGGWGADRDIFCLTSFPPPVFRDFSVGDKKSNNVMLAVRWALLLLAGND